MAACGQRFGTVWALTGRSKNPIERQKDEREPGLKIQVRVSGCVPQSGRRKCDEHSSPESGKMVQTTVAQIGPRANSDREPAEINPKILLVLGRYLHVGLSAQPWFGPSFRFLGRNVRRIFAVPTVARSRTRAPVFSGRVPARPFGARSGF